MTWAQPAMIIRVMASAYIEHAIGMMTDPKKQTAFGQYLARQTFLNTQTTK